MLNFAVASSLGVVAWRPSLKTLANVSGDFVWEFLVLRLMPLVVSATTPFWLRSRREFSCEKIHLLQCPMPCVCSCVRVRPNTFCACFRHAKGTRNNVRHAGRGYHVSFRVQLNDLCIISSRQTPRRAFFVVQKTLRNPFWCAGHCGHSFSLRAA